MTDTNINSDDNWCEHGVPYSVDCKRCRESEDLPKLPTDMQSDLSGEHDVVLDAINKECLHHD